MSLGTRVDETHCLEAKLYGEAVDLDRRSRHDRPLEIRAQARRIDVHAATLGSEDERSSAHALDFADELDPTLIVARRQHGRRRDDGRLRRGFGRRRCRCLYEIAGRATRRCGRGRRPRLVARRHGRAVVGRFACGGGAAGTDVPFVGAFAAGVGAAGATAAGADTAGAAMAGAAGAATAGAGAAGAAMAGADATGAGPAGAAAAGGGAVAVTPAGAGVITVGAMSAGAAVALAAPLAGADDVAGAAAAPATGGRPASSSAMAASGLGPLPKPTALISWGVRPSRPMTTTRVPAFTDAS